MGDTVSTMTNMMKVKQETELDFNKLTREYKFIGFYFTSHASTPCKVWNSAVKQLKHDLNLASKDFLCIIVPISTIDLEQVEMQT